MIFAPGKRARIAATAGSLLASRKAFSRLVDSISASVWPPSSFDSETSQLRPVQALQLGGQVVEQHLRRVAGQADSMRPGSMRTSRTQRLSSTLKAMSRLASARATMSASDFTGTGGGFGTGSGGATKAHAAAVRRLDQPHRLRRRQVGGMRVCATALAPPPCQLAGDPRRRAACRAAPETVAVQRFQRLVRRRQVGGVGEPDQHHFGGADRPVGGLHLECPSAASARSRASTRTDSVSAKSAPRVRSSSVSEASLGGRRHEAQPRDEMGELGKVGQHGGRIGAGIVLRCGTRQVPPPTSPLITCSNRSMMRPRSARPSIGAHRVGA